MIEIGIVGAKNSGKTTLLEALLPKLVARGLKVATIKHTGHSHTFDTAGKDSYRHRRAGAGLTVALSQTEMALFAEPTAEYYQMATEIIAQNFDLCLVEGNKSSERPKILLTRNLDSIKPPIPSNLITSYGIVKYSAELHHHGENQIEELAEFILDRTLSANAKRGQQ